MSQSFHSVRVLGVLVMLQGCLVVPALAQTPVGLSAARARYQQELAECKTDPTANDLAACVKEARNSLAEFQRGRMNDVVAPAELERNALQRCEVHKGDDKADCMARMRGLGRTQGSVAGGGILRELETVISVPSQ